MSSASRYTPAHMRPGLSTPFGSKPSFTRLLRAARPASCGSNTSTDARSAAGARTSVAWPPMPRPRPGSSRRPARRRTASRPRSARRPNRRTSAPPGDQPRDRVALAGRGRDAPERPLARRVAGERRHIAHAAPERARILLVEQRDRRRTAASAPASACLRCLTEGATPSSRNTVAASGFGRPSK